MSFGHSFNERDYSGLKSRVLELETKFKKLEESTSKKSKSLNIPDVRSSLPLSQLAKDKLEFIKGSSIYRDFPDTKPTLEWTGAVLDLLDELGLGNDS